MVARNRGTPDGRTVSATRWPVGTTARGGVGVGVHPDGPLRHAATAHRASEHGRNLLAVCGASIRPYYVREPAPDGDVVYFDPAHPRACPKCARAVR